MNYLVLGDLSDKLVKACNNDGRKILSVSKLISNSISMMQNEYKAEEELSKQENSLWKYFLFRFATAYDADLLSKARGLLSPKICRYILSEINEGEKFLIHFNVYSDDLLSFFEKNLSKDFIVVYNDSDNKEAIRDKALLEILYSRPRMGYINTKKSRVKSILSDLSVVSGKLHKYALRPIRMGLDISMNSTGVGCSCIANDGAVDTLYGTLKTKRTALDVDRIGQINNIITSAKLKSLNDGAEYIVDLHLVEQACVEGGALGAVQGAFRIGLYSGMFLRELRDYGPHKKFFYVYPSALKKYITGYGRAAKGLMIIKIKEIMRLKEDLPLNDDEADALCLLHCLVSDEINLKDENLNTAY